MVKAAYSSGKPAIGVGAGNTPAIIDESADIVLAVNSIIHSKTFDNGMICASEQSVIILESIYDKVKNEFANRGCYFLNEEELDKVRKTIIINGSLNSSKNFTKILTFFFPSNSFRPYFEVLRFTSSKDNPVVKFVSNSLTICSFVFLCIFAS